jgi:hypothetical protein
MNFHRVTGAGHELVHDPLGLSLQQMPERLHNFLPGRADDWLLVVLAACWLALAISAARVRGLADAAAGEGAEAERGRGLHGWGVEACMLGALALYLIAPRSMRLPFYWHMINGRFVVALAFFALLMVRGPIAGARRLWLVPVVVAHLVYMAALCRAFVAFNRHAWGLDPLVAEIPRDKSVLTLILKPMGDSSVNVSAFNQFPSYVQLRHGGYNHYNFAEGFPLRYKLMWTAPPWSHADEFRWKLHARPWDYFITFREGWESSPMKEPLAQGKVRLVDQKGEWRLYQKVAPDAEEAPPSPAEREP